MKINFDARHHANDPLFQDLDIGECFLYDGYNTVFMKTEDVSDCYNCRCNAINLATGVLVLMDNNDAVKPISVSLNKED